MSHIVVHDSDNYFKVTLLSRVESEHFLTFRLESRGPPIVWPAQSKFPEPSCVSHRNS